jgi:glucose/arabinose dehydrogenase
MATGMMLDTMRVILCSLILGAIPLAGLRAQTVSGLDAVRVASGLTQPVFVTAPPGDAGRLFIVQQNGEIRILNLTTGTLNPTPFLTLTGLAAGGEQGLLGMAFDPNYASNGKFYLNFTVPGGAFGNGVTHVSQFSITSNPNIANAASERILLTFDHPQANHNGGWIGFSPRAGDANNLYIATGDGGGANDQGTGHIEPGGNAQSLTTLLGKMLRIQINSAAGTFTIPSNNPFVGMSGARAEIFAFGLRNPYRNSFDRQTGTMFIGDVGQTTREEIDVQRPTNAGGGENYGWRVREGSVQNPAYPGIPTPPGAVDPIYDYPRSVGQTVIGGYVYRGQRIPNLRGVYIFADFQGPEPGPNIGQIFSLNYNGTSASNFQNITSQLFPTSAGGFTLSSPSSLGEDANGELYITDLGNGSVFKIVSSTQPPAAKSDFNGDGEADILWQHTSGTRAIWLMNGTTHTSSANLGAVPTSWNIVGSGDFNRDGETDILWQNTSGARLIWLMNGVVHTGSVSLGVVATSWNIVGSADFNGDGSADILWQNGSGARAIWLMNGTTYGSSAYLESVAPSWSIAGSGDFNGDGDPDILWQHSSGARVIWLMNGVVHISSVSLGTVATSWKIVGSADFNGDEETDILWQHSSGARALWIMNGVTYGSTVNLGTVSTSWNIRNY